MLPLHIINRLSLWPAHPTVMALKDDFRFTFLLPSFFFFLPVMIAP